MKTERRESLETINVTAEPLAPRRRPPSCREVSNPRTGGEHRGSGDGMSAKGSRSQHGKPDTVGRKIPTGTPRGADWAGSGDGEVRSSNEASNDRGAKGPQFKGNAEVVRARRLM
jgi:hypothetical protein